MFVSREREGERAMCTYLHNKLNTLISLSKAAVPVKCELSHLLKISIVYVVIASTLIRTWLTSRPKISIFLARIFLRRGEFHRKEDFKLCVAPYRFFITSLSCTLLTENFVRAGVSADGHTFDF